MSLCESLHRQSAGLPMLKNECTQCTNNAAGTYHKPHQIVQEPLLSQTNLGHCVLGGQSETFTVRSAQQVYLLLTYRPLILNKQKILLAAASSAYKHSLKEVMASQGIASQIKVRCVICVNIMQCKQLYRKAWERFIT